MHTSRQSCNSILWLRDVGYDILFRAPLLCIAQLIFPSIRTPSFAMSASAEEGAKKLLHSLVGSLKHVWTVDDGNNVFGHLYGDPRSILDSLATLATREENVGNPYLPPPVAVQSLPFECTPYLDLQSPLLPATPTQQPIDNATHGVRLKSWHEIPLQVRNSTAKKLRIRWIDSHHQPRSSHTWDLSPSPSAASPGVDGDTTTWTQYSKPGDFFLFSFVDREGSVADLFTDDVPSEETVVGAYRPLRPLPSGAVHSIVVCQEKHQPHEEQREAEIKVLDGSNTDDEEVVILESVLVDSYDALCVAAASLDANRDTNDARTTVKLVSKILSNLQNHPDDERYRKLRLSNAKMQAHVVSSGGALQFLTLAGFERQKLQPPMSSMDAEEFPVSEEEDSLVCPDDGTVDEEELLVLKGTRVRALQLLEVLSNRTLPSFVPDLALPTPWQPPLELLGATSAPIRRSNPDGYRGGMFISDDERWARAERIASNRRSGRSRRPAPGQAPSSRGNWGR